MVNGDGCDSNCLIERGWNCTGGSAFSKDTCNELCGDGIFFKKDHTCDEKSSEGCSNLSCQTVPGYICDNKCRISNIVSLVSIERFDN